MKALKMICKGILQAWGTDDCSWSDLRKTELYPTTSAITGLLACALGYKKDSEEFKELSNSFTLYIDKDASITGKILEDFQVIGAGVKNEDGTRGKIYTANKSTKETPLVTKQYLNDAYFELYIVAEEELLDKFASALDKPVWPYFLGRKSCIPSRRVNGGICEIDTKERNICIGQ